MTCTRLSSAGRKPAYRHSSRNRYSKEIQREVQVGNSDQKRTQGSDYPPRHRPRYRRCGRPLRDAGRLGHAYGDADHCLGGKVGQWLPLVPDFQHSDIVVAGGGGQRRRTSGDSTHQSLPGGPARISVLRSRSPRNWRRQPSSSCCYAATIPASSLRRNRWRN